MVSKNLNSKTLIIPNNFDIIIRYFTYNNIKIIRNNFDIIIRYFTYK